VGNRHKLLMAAVLLGLAHLALVIVFGDKGVVELHRQRAAYQRQVADNHRLERHNLALFRKIQRLKNDPAYIEALARQQMLVRPEEIVISLPSPSPEP